jgi:putative mRNA 3-end processing factor
MNRAYRTAGVELPATTHVAEASSDVNWSTALVVAPPSVHGTPWTRRLGPASTAFASGWMRLRGTRRRRAIDRGFVVSDHVDWPSLLVTIDATSAKRVLLTHGYTAVVARWLRDQGWDADVLATRYEGERDDVAGSEDGITSASACTDI